MAMEAECKYIQYRFSDSERNCDVIWYEAVARRGGRPMTSDSAASTPNAMEGGTTAMSENHD